jgi:hypothetical protein
MNIEPIGWRPAAVAFGLSALCILHVPACGSGGGGATGNPDPPVIDPGGPFSTSIPAGRHLQDLNTGEQTQLCADIAMVDRAFLQTAVLNELTCRSLAIDTATGEAIDAGDAGPLSNEQLLAFCEQGYRSCTALAATEGLVRPCVLPLDPTCRSMPVTVGDLSACLNELAAAHPVETCVTSPTCSDTYGADAMTSQTRSPSLHAPNLPACTRLDRMCPPAALFFPCGI